MPSWRDDLPLKVTNLVSYFLFLGSNGYSALGPNKGHYATGAQDVSSSLFAAGGGRDDDLN